MGRPSKITPEVQSLIEAHRAPGLRVAALHRALIAAGVTIARGTLDAYLRRAPDPTWPGHMAPRVPLEADAAQAIDGDDLARLTRVRDDIDRAMAGWRSELGVNDRAVRAYAQLARIHGEVTARLVELRPRPEVEAERLEALGTGARQALLDRATAAAGVDADLRGQIARQRQVIDSLVDAGPA